MTVITFRDHRGEGGGDKNTKKDLFFIRMDLLCHCLKSSILYRNSDLYGRGRALLVSGSSGGRGRAGGRSIYYNIYSESAQGLSGEKSLRGPDRARGDGARPGRCPSPHPPAWHVPNSSVPDSTGSSGHPAPCLDQGVPLPEMLPVGRI